MVESSELEETLPLDVGVDGGGGGGVGVVVVLEPDDEDDEPPELEVEPPV